MDNCGTSRKHLSGKVGSPSSFDLTIDIASFKKAKNSIAKNAIKFKREVPISEFESKEDKSAAENAKALKNMIKSKMKSVKKKKWKKQSFTWPMPNAQCQSILLLQRTDQISSLKIQ